MISEQLLNEMGLQALAALRNKDYELAITIADEILDTDIDSPMAHAVRFTSFFKSGQLERARKIGGRAAELNPNSEFILNNQACLQLEAKQPAAASGLLKSLIEKYGETPQWRYNLGLAQRMVGNYSYAIDSFEHALDLDPTHDKAAYQLAECLIFVGQPKEATRAFEFVRLLRNKHAPSHANYIHHATISDGLTPNALEQELSLWRDRFIPKNTRYAPKLIDNSKAVHIGFVLDTLPVDWFEKIIAPVVNHLAMSSDTISLYTHNEQVRIKQVDNRIKLVDAKAMSDTEFAKKVRMDNVQIIVDVCGMRKSTRQRALGLQLAARQFAWLTHEGEFAAPYLKAVEGMLGSQRFFIDDNATPPGNGFPSKTFAGIGCKPGLSRAILCNWAFILQNLRDWKLHLDVVERSAQRTFKTRFRDLGVNEEQLLFDKALTPQKGSIALDNFVYNNPVAVSSALRSGACVVATKGALFPAQQTAAIFKQVGLEHTLSETPLEYAERAIALARGLKSPAIATTEQLDQSNLNNVEAFAKSFRAALLSE